MKRIDFTYHKNLNLLSRLNLFQERRDLSIPSKFRVGELLVDNLQPLGGIFKPGITKAGRLSISGYLNSGKKVKLYNSFKKEQVYLRKVLGESFKKQDILFPPIISNDDNFIIEEWIEGKTLAKINPKIIEQHRENIKQFLKKIHNDPFFCEIANNNLNSFCYLKDYLIPRLKLWENWLPIKKLINQWQDSYSNIENKIDSRISHPDLSLSNIILSKDNKIYIIDNELLGVGKGWILDRRNSFFRKEFPTPSSDPEKNNFYNLSWKLRLVGSSLDNGDFHRAERMADIEYI